MERLTEKLDKFNYKLVRYNSIVRANARYKLGSFEDLLENADSIKIIKRNGVASLHIDMILDNEMLDIAEQLFGKEKVLDYDK